MEKIKFTNKFSGEKVEILLQFTDIWGRTCIKYRRLNPVYNLGRKLQTFNKPLRVFNQTYEADRSN